MLPEGRSRDGNKRRGAAEKRVVLKMLVLEMLKAYHDAPYAGHPRAKKTRKKIRKWCYWDGMRKDINDYGKNCRSCNTHKDSKNRKSAPLQAFDEVGRPFERRAMDIMSEAALTAVSSKENQCVLLFTDHLTR